jgi:uncharacterized protein YneF (UPF0154 family)
MELLMVGSFVLGLLIGYLLGFNTFIKQMDKDDLL